jgi:hypothetical protein
MRHPFPERLRLTPLFVHMMGKKITGLPGVKYNIRLGKRPAGCLSLVVDYKILKM